MLGFTVETHHDHQLRWTARTTTEALVIQVFGQVDAHNESDWQHMLRECAATAPERSLFIVDCAEMDFMSCGALVASAKQTADSRQLGVTMRLVIRQPSIMRIITKCGMEDSVSAYPDLDSALKGHRPP